MFVNRIKRGLAGCVLIVASFLTAVIATILLAPVIYQTIIPWLKLEEVSGLTQDQLIVNFQAIVFYLLNPFADVLEMPYFQSSPGGLQHFAEVRELIVSGLFLAILALISSRFVVRWLKKRRYRLIMQPWFFIGQILPLVVLFVALMAFDQLFLLFHQLFFQNDLWLFNPLHDPVITVLPEQLFLIYFVTIILIYEVILWFYRWLVLRK